MTDSKLAFTFTPPERGTILPIKMDRARWFALVEQNNAQQYEKYRPHWYQHEAEELYERLHG